jgi:hypothetical protein
MKKKMAKCKVCGKTALKDSVLCRICSTEYAPVEMIILYPKKLVPKSKCDNCNELALCVGISFNGIEAVSEEKGSFTFLCGKCLLSVRKNLEENAPGLIPASELEGLSEAIRKISMQEISYK